MRYPTKNEILKPYRIDPVMVELILEWKSSVWRIAKKHGKTAKNTAIRDLVIDLARVKGKRVEVVIEDTPEGPNFDSSRNLITLSTTPSVITGLHELSHKLFGGGELTACRFSVHHFKKCFPIAYEKLKWNGHMLTKLQRKEQEICLSLR